MSTGRPRGPARLSRLLDADGVEPGRIFTLAGWACGPVPVIDGVGSFLQNREAAARGREVTRANEFLTAPGLPRLLHLSRQFARGRTWRGGA